MANDFHNANLLPVLLTGISFNPNTNMDKNYLHYKMWDEITYPFLNLNGATADVWKWVSNFITQITVHVITYPSWH